eukprot:3494044-Prymnesium_polylepis.1
MSSFSLSSWKRIVGGGAMASDRARRRRRMERAIVGVASNTPQAATARRRARGRWPMVAPGT